jgi:hypothetical protein
MKSNAGSKRLVKKMLDFKDQLNVVLDVSLAGWKNSMMIRYRIEFMIVICVTIFFQIYITRFNNGMLTAQDMFGKFMVAKQDGNNDDINNSSHKAFFDELDLVSSYFSTAMIVALLYITLPIEKLITAATMKKLGRNSI